VAFAIFNGGATLNSPSETVTVQAGGESSLTPTTTPPTGPTVNITSPANGATFTNLDSITLTANATPLAGTTITEVAYSYSVEGSNPITMPIGTSTLAPYRLIWNPITIAGTVLLLATATDSLGRQGQSPTVTIQVTMAPTPTPATGFCMVHYQLNSQWTGGFSGSLTMTNTGTTAYNGWVLQFTFSGDQQITQIWNGSIRQSGETVTISNLSYNAGIAPGGSTNLGFNGTWTHNDSPPTSFTLNGMGCIIG
jgi:cellulase/cellobiase CelA1